MVLTGSVLYRHAFGAVISKFQEQLASSGTLGAMQYGKGSDAGKATYTGAMAVIKPSDSDFICDVELAARRVLDKGELAVFNVKYKSCAVVVDDTEPEGSDECFEEHIFSYPEEKRVAVRRLDNRIREKLGKQLIEVGLYPVEEYRKPVDARRPKRKSQHRWSHLY